MLNRLAELRAAAGVKGGSDAGSSAKEGFHSAAAPQVRPTNVDIAVKEVLEDDRAVWKAIKQVQAHTQLLRDLSIEVFHTVLPTKLQKLQSQLEDEDKTCSTLIRRCKELLVELEGSGGEEVPVAQSMRENLHRHATQEFRKQLQNYMTLNNERREAMEQQARRRLRLAFPQAKAEELENLLECPELASQVLTRRVEGGCVLQDVLEEEEASGSNDMARLEREAEELKALFVQFAELVQQQGEALDAIEVRIHHVVEETEVTIEVLENAKQERKRLQRSQMCAIGLVWILIICLVYFLVRKAYRGVQAVRGTSNLQTEMTQVTWPVGLQNDSMLQMQHLEAYTREQEHLHRQQHHHRQFKQQLLLHEDQPSGEQPWATAQAEIFEEQTPLKEPQQLVLQFQHHGAVSLLHGVHKQWPRFKSHRHGPPPTERAGNSGAAREVQHPSSRTGPK